MGPLSIFWWHNFNTRKKIYNIFQIQLQCRRPRFNPWVGKIPRRREWQPTAVFLMPRELLSQWCRWGEVKNSVWGGFCGSPEVKTSPFNAGDLGAKIPHASWPKNQKQKTEATNSIKTLKMVHIKKKIIKTKKNSVWHTWSLRCPLASYPSGDVEWAIEDKRLWVWTRGGR